MYAQLIGRAELCLVLLPAPNQLLQPNQPTAATKSAAAPRSSLGPLEPLLTG
jgi:hypothetical protein